MDRCQLELEDGDNFDNKATAHLVANTFVVAGILTQEDMQRLYKAYPWWKKKV